MQTYFGLHGATLAPGGSAVGDLEEANPLGGGPISARFTVTLESAAADLAVLSTTTTFDARQVLQSVKAMAAQAGAPMNDADLATARLAIRLVRAPAR